MISYINMPVSRNHRFNKTFLVKEFDTLDVDENRVELKNKQSNLIKIDYSNNERNDLKSELKNIIRVFRFIKTMKRKVDNEEYTFCLSFKFEEAIDLIRKMSFKNDYMSAYGLTCLYFRFMYYHYKNILKTPNGTYLYINGYADSSIKSMWKEKTEYNITIPSVYYNHLLFTFGDMSRYIASLNKLESELDALKLYYQIINEKNLLGYYDLVLYQKDISNYLIPLGRSRDKERKLQMYRLLNYMSFSNIIYHRW